MKRVSDDALGAEVESVCAQLQTLADGLGADGLITASGVVLMGRQCVRALWTRLQVAKEPLHLEPKRVAVPPSEGPSDQLGEGV